MGVGSARPKKKGGVREQIYRGGLDGVMRGVPPGQINQDSGGVFRSVKIRRRKTYKPPAFLFVQPRYQQIDLMMPYLIGMLSIPMHLQHWHCRTVFTSCMTHPPSLEMWLGQAVYTIKRIKRSCLFTAAYL